MPGKPAKSHRHEREYESLDDVKDWAKIKDAATTGQKDVTRLIDCLAAWMRDLKAWGEDVRDDIIRLETAVRAARGEPGDPPPAPKK